MGLRSFDERRPSLPALAALGLAALLLVAAKGRDRAEGEVRHAEDLVPVDCLLPAPLRRLGRYAQTVGPRRAIRTTAVDCRIRGGEYSEDRSDYAFALEVWLPQAQTGDAEAQTYVGEIYEKGIRGTPDYPAALTWYRRAAGQGSSRAAMSLGYLYEKGLGVVADPAEALRWYRRASGLPAEMIVLDLPGEPVRSPAALQPPPGTALATAVEWGRYYALVIGNDDYREWPKLKTAVSDARDVQAILAARYGFAEARLLLNATRDQVLSALEDFREKLTKDDNFLLYYAGHGQLLPELNRAYWIPVDGGRDRIADWIWLDEITGHLDLMAAKHALVIADSCYSGVLTRSGVPRLRQGMSWEDQILSMKRLAEKPARLALTSGGVSPVLDEGDGRHSVFAKELLAVLAANDGVLVTNELFEAVRARVTAAAAGRSFDQVPQLAPIRNSKHAGGEFVLVPRSR